MAAQAIPRSGTRSGSLVRASVTDQRLGGALLSVAGAIILLGIVSAEALYPRAYSTGANQISDLGGTEPPGSLVFQPSAMIFGGSMVVVGILVVVGAWFVQRAFRRRSVTIPLALLGFGALGVGLFPGSTGTPHAIFAMLTFVSGGVGALTAARVATGPFRYLSILFGTVSLLTLVSYLLLREAGPMAGLGLGGVERWIVYPIVIWVSAFGGYLAGRADGAAVSGAVGPG